MTPRIEQVARMDREGISIGTIASHLGISEMTVYNHLFRARKCGVPTRANPLRGQPWVKIIAPTLLGKTPKEIGDELGLKASTVRVYQCHAREAGDLPATQSGNEGMRI